MSWLGRRGDEGMVLEVLISIAFFMLFGVAMYLYINTHATADLYYSRYYASDLSTLAEVALAAPGDVLITHDNVKPGYTFWLEDGQVGVAPTTKEKPGGLVIGAYGTSGAYKGARRIDITEPPGTLLVRKISNAFAITGNSVLLEGCPRATATPGQVWLEIDPSLVKEERERISKSFADSLKSTSIRIAPSADKASLVIKLKMQTGDRARIEAQPVDTNGRAYACLFTEELSRITLVEFTHAPPVDSTSTVIDLTLVSTPEDSVRNQQVGWALAYALARYFS